MTSQDAELVRAWHRAREGPQNMAQEMGKLKGRTAEADAVSGRMVRSAVSGFVNMAAGALSVRAALRLVNQEYELMLQRQKNAADFQTGLVGTQRAAIRNLGDADIRLLSQTLPGIGQATGADLRGLYEAASGVLSARGQISGKEAIGQLGAVARLDPSLAPSEMQSLAGASLDIRKAFGGTAEQAIGAMLASQSTARVEETGQFARNVVPALIGLKNFGTEFREASAMVAAITQESADVEGARSGTAAITFAKQIAQATAAVKTLEGKGTTERIDWLISGDPAAEKIRQRLLGSIDAEARKAGRDERGELTSEAKQFMAVTGLLTPGSAGRKAYETALAATPEIGEAEKQYQRQFDLQKELGGAQRVGRMRELFRGMQQSVESDPDEGAAGAAREDIGKLLDQAGTFGAAGLPTSWARRAERMEFGIRSRFGVSPEEIIADQLRARAESAELLEISDPGLYGFDAQRVKLFREKADELDRMRLEQEGFGASLPFRGKMDATLRRLDAAGGETRAERAGRLGELGRFDEGVAAGGDPHRVAAGIIEGRRPADQDTPAAKKQVELLQEALAELKAIKAAADGVDENTKDREAPARGKRRGAPSRAPVKGLNN